MRSFKIRTPYQDDHVKVNYTGGCVPRVGGKKRIHKNHKEEGHLEDLGVDERIVSNGS